MLFGAVLRERPDLLGAFVVDVTGPFNLAQDGQYGGTSSILTCAPPWDRFFLESPTRRSGSHRRYGLAVQVTKAGDIGERWKSAPDGWIEPTDRWILDCDLYCTVDGEAEHLLALLVPVLQDGRIPLRKDNAERSRILRKKPAPAFAHRFLGELEAELDQRVEEVTKGRRRLTLSLSREIDQFRARIALLKAPFTDEEQETVANIAGQFLWSIQFMHCKNVEVVPVEPKQPRVRVGGKKHGNKAPSYRYHVLEIAPMRRILRDEGGMGENGEGVERAIHICRGHFKDYRERGVFGRHKGLYWWDQHVRGEVSVGVVDKDYSVRDSYVPAPAADPQEEPS